MINLNLAKRNADALRILCLGAHSDDIEIGCGGTLLQWKQAYGDLSLDWVVFCASGARAGEARAAAELFASGNKINIVLKEFRDGFLPHTGGAVKEFFEQLKPQVDPDVIFTHRQKDAHQDHRLIAELTWNTFRNHLILEYEIPKYDGDMGRPQVFVPLDSEIHQSKVRHIMRAFKSQHAKAWFQESTFLSLMRLRGMECNAPSGHAEAFYCRKLVL